MRTYLLQLILKCLKSKKPEMNSINSKKSGLKAIFTYTSVTSVSTLRCYTISFAPTAKSLTSFTTAI